MKCGYPNIINGRAFGCGQCLNCRINQRRVWQHRLMLEAREHEENAFVTLTYDQENIPEGGTLYPPHLRNYFKRLRKNLHPRKVRYFAAGEYGETTGHPHYHVALFGAPSCRRGLTRLSRSGKPCCDVCTLHRDTWGHGHVYLGQLTDESAAYTVGYVIKKIYREKGDDNPDLYPEFARMSNRPGIGAGAMDELASTLMCHRLDGMEDVPMALRHGKKILPLGRYLRRRLRTRLGRSPDAPQSILDKIEEEVRPLREMAQQTAQNGFKQIAFREALIQQAAAKSTRLKHLQRLQRKKGNL